VAVTTDEYMSLNRHNKLIQIVDPQPFPKSLYKFNKEPLEDNKMIQKIINDKNPCR